MDVVEIDLVDEENSSVTVFSRSHFIPFERGILMDDGRDSVLLGKAAQRMQRCIESKRDTTGYDNVCF